jgi:hypothetical protein
MSPITNAPRGRTVRRALLLSLAAGIAVAVASRGIARAQTANVGNRAPARVADGSALHMEMSPARPLARGDSARAAAVAADLRRAIEKYRDTTAAVADGYRMFAPQIRNQKVYHFTRGWSAVQEACRFDPSKPTSLLYVKGTDGRFVLVGGMYTAPKRFSLEKLDERVPLSVARWHKHVNWCVPPHGQEARWLERTNGQPVFGPESPIATKGACDAVGGVFHPSLLGWMVHANVMTSSAPSAIWGDDHAGHDMHDGMKHDMQHDMGDMQHDGT